MGTDFAQGDGSRIVVCQIGFACFIMAVGRALRDVGTLFAWTGLSTLGTVLSPNIAHVVALLAISLLAVQRGTRHYGMRANILSSALLVGGFLATLAMVLLEWSNPVAVVLVGILFGVGGAIGFMTWVCRFWLEGPVAACEILAASLFACVIGFAVGFISDLVVVLSICIVLCVVSSICMNECYRSSEAPAQSNADSQASLASRRELFGRIMLAVVPPGACIGTLGLMSAVARSMVAVQDMGILITATMVGEIIACFLLILMFSRGRLRAEATSFYKFLFPLGAVSFLALTFIGGRFVVVLSAISEFAFSLCSVLMTLQAIELCHRLSCTPPILYGVFSAISHAIITVGYLIVSPMGDGISDTTYPIVAVLVIFILAMVSQFVLYRMTRYGADSKLGPEAKLGMEPKPIQKLEPAPRLEQNPSIAASDPPQEGMAGAFAGVMQTQTGLASVIGGVDLSKREGEVLALILQGRDVPYIAEELCVSKNTVRTHVKSVYAKFDVHSRQELIDLFQQARHGN